MTSPTSPGTFAERLEAAWARTDTLFALVAPDAFLTRPISLRHPLVFYVGHLPAFAWNHICRGALGQPAFNARFDEIFDRGIDPDVDDPTQCHAHPEVPDQWPPIAEVIAYRDRVRSAVVEAVAEVDARDPAAVMARHGRVCAMVLEHELMHQETLLYMVQQLPPDRVRRPEGVRYPDRARRPGAVVDVPGGTVTLGAHVRAAAFGWDNEFPHHAVTVPGFAIDALPVTNGEFLAFVEEGGYDQRRFWTEADWRWRLRGSLARPVGWSRPNGHWRYRTLFETIALADAADWPVYVSLAEARAYARWSGGRLPTEAEFHRAAYGSPDGVERPYPWGSKLPGRHHGNFDFAHWSPAPVGSHPAGASAWGVHELVGNGWELTDTPFAPFAGFRAYSRYPGYSADFFDGKHYVVKGASWATASDLTRRSFRNWYQAHYPYVFAKFRCVRRDAGAAASASSA